jgi:hypothetical protein
MEGNFILSKQSAEICKKIPAALGDNSKSEIDKGMPAEVDLQPW